MTRAIVAAFLFASPAVLSRAASVPSTGFGLRDLRAPEIAIKGLAVDGEFAYFTEATNFMRLNTANGNFQHVAAIPPGVIDVSFIAARSGTVYTAITYNYATYEFGRIDQTNFVALGSLSGVYDGVVGPDGNLYMSAAHGSPSGSKIFRYDPVQQALTNLAYISLWSGGLAFDPSNRLHVVSPNNGDVYRFTLEQLASGRILNASNDAEVVANAAQGGYLAFDPQGRLYVTTGYGASLWRYDLNHPEFPRQMASVDSYASALGFIKWSPARKSMFAINTDYLPDWSTRGTLHEITFAPFDDGVPGTSSVIRSWIAAYTDLQRPFPGSGGYMVDTNGIISATPSRAIIGKPASFENLWPLGNILSLGRSGSITLAFEDVIINGSGPDFAVFEYAVSYGGENLFAELAFVEVATTTNAWARFPVTCFVTNPVGRYDEMDVTKLDGFAGKHSLEAGTPFDLDWLRTHPNVLNGSVDLNHIAYVRLVDVIGDGTLTDDLGNAIYDPFDYELGGYWSTDGFDLRGVGVINSAGLGVVRDEGSPAMTMMTQAGRTYQLQYSVGDNNWIDYGEPFSSTGGVHHVILPDDLGAAMFRIEQFIPVEP